MKSAGLESSGPAFLLKRNGWIGMLTGLGILMLLLFVPLVPALCAEDVDSGRIRAVFFPVPGQEFHMEFTHSVNRTAVREYYVIESDRILLTRAEYSSFGAGMPEVPEVSGSTLTLEKGILHLRGIDTPMDSLVYRIGTVAAHTLHINGKSTPLQAIAPPQTALRFQYQRVSAYAFLRRLNRSD